MLRISKRETCRDMLTIRLEGRLTGPWVDEVKKVIGQDGGTSRLIVVEISELIFADMAGATLLADLQNRGITLSGGSPFLQELLKCAN
jgi:hypothetical protein